MFEHVVRRGLEHAPAVVKGAAQSTPPAISPFGGIVLGVTLLASLVLMFAVSYTLHDVLPILAMVETPAAAITVSHPQEPASKEEKEDLLETGPAMTLVHRKPITASIRGTIRHLIAEAGKLACWRGFLYSLLYTVVLMNATQLMAAFFRLPELLTAAAAGAITANLHAAWTHKVISTPSNVGFWQRVPARSSWKVLALPAIVRAVMPLISVYIILISFIALNSFTEVGDYSGARWVSIILRLSALFIVAVFCTIFLCLPAFVTQIRVEASILPEDQDVIVPFDRTFDGKVVSKALGGTGAVGFLDAWKSFNWDARRRLIKLQLKVICISVALSSVVLNLLMFEMIAIVGSSALVDALAQAQRQLQNQALST